MQRRVNVGAVEPVPDRDPGRVLADVREGAVSLEAAERDYGVVLASEGRSWVLDQAATQAQRAQMRAKR